MKTQLTLLAALAFGAFVSPCFAQKADNILKQPPADIKIDGNLKDWGDSLRYHNEDKKLDYSLANDKENIYMAIRISDHSEQMRVLAAGLTLGISPKGKKKDEYSITFPVGDQGSTPMFGRHVMGADSITQADRDELMRARLTKLRNIKVEGFSDIEGDMITTSNTYGIHTAIDYDENGYLVYEAAVPLKLLHADANGKKEWAFDFKINGITRPANNGGNGGDHAEGLGGGGMGRGGRGGMGGGGMRGGGGMGGGRGGMRGGMGGGQGSGADHSEMSKSVDFWEKFYLGN
ncbi:hypothetical protein [Mucilaginibacter sp. KACC 22063]|uniref:hypothetical protein n=1 Tax=Mucilaginibacter sp. KACC 22063 TaxID=3025666 RepID=UPI002365D0D2|nr:hypothetical protein [Mucilaginibacter sp. KACC 22063]WDF55538.1 hypothetical protein PQ461_00505 [Mucilaginibacter sp. KACC 22063]